jgi:hypothetical protein
MTLTDLTSLLDRYATGELTLAALQQQFAAVLAADPLDVEESDATPWNEAHDEARLSWRLIYLFDAEIEDGEAPRRLACHVVRCLARTGSADATFELLPLLVDQERFCAIVGKHVAGIISRTGFLNVLAESGYPSHVKLWLEHAPPTVLERLCAMLEAEAYDLVVGGFERPPR